MTACPTSPRHGAQAERILIVAGDALVAFADRRELLAADDLVDRAERPVAGAAETLPQDGVGRRGPIGPHHLGGRLEPPALVGFERRDRIGGGGGGGGR